MLQELETDRLILRPYRDWDVERMALLLGNWDVTKWLAEVPFPYTLEDADEFLERQKLKQAPNFGRAIDNGEGLIGGMGIHEPSEELGIDDPTIVELGYWLGEPYWGQGYATEAGHAIIAHAFEALGAKHVVAGAITENKGSLNVLTKLGFEVVGTGDFYCRPQDRRVPSTQFILSRERWRTLLAIG